MTLSLSISPMGECHTFILEGRLPVTVARPTSIYKTRLYIETIYGKRAHFAGSPGDFGPYLTPVLRTMCEKLRHARSLATISILKLYDSVKIKTYSEASPEPEG
jgi:hypothetical protein